jgi:3-phenylpropionate/trans-cinnamate dioxygenase ferredoxin reductase subunit
VSDGAIVIVGGGPAAQAAAAAYREAGGRGRVRILAAEPLLPYERPPLSKEFLRGEMPRFDLLLEPAQWYREHEIEVVRGTRVERIDTEKGLALTDEGVAYRFEQCLLATGARPQAPEALGVDLPFVQRIRSVPDAERLARAAGCRVLVVGSGFIGCEAAVSLAMRNAKVTVATLEAGPQIERLGERVSERLAGWLADWGVEVLPEAELAEISQSDDPGGTIEFKDGRAVDAAAVLLAIGVTRNDELAAAAGIEVDDGIPTDASMRTSRPGLLAAGDVAFAENSAAGRRLRVEHWGEALNQGEVAGKTMAGVDARWDAAPGFWSSLGERTVKYAGWGDGWDEVRFEQGDDDSFAAWYRRDGELAGVVAHERDADYEAGRERIEGREQWS